MPRVPAASSSPAPETPARLETSTPTWGGFRFNPEHPSPCHRLRSLRLVSSSSQKNHSPESALHIRSSATCCEITSIGTTLPSSSILKLSGFVSDTSNRPVRLIQNFPCSLESPIKPFAVTSLNLELLIRSSISRGFACRISGLPRRKLPSSYRTSSQKPPGLTPETGRQSSSQAPARSPRTRGSLLLLPRLLCQPRLLSLLFRDRPQRILPLRPRGKLSPGFLQRHG